MNDKVRGAFVDDGLFDNNVEIYHQCFRPSDNVYSAELLAIKLAIDYAISSNLPKVNIVSDSRSVLLAKENVNNNDIHIISIKNRIRNHKGQIKLHWIKARMWDIWTTKGQTSLLNLPP
ncbi:hypothetical protein CDAR_430571 [Caerostris darwini]|uniref:RNase H type-1 domain-containing protein n=1 Tax=Caerostris darwini TaxID=1538125 RepID=A0AAV4QFG9_9ARAC|nr:hypothetical protein CDAR_430571 [Caerostris darwini]